MTESKSKYGVLWSRDELVLSLYLYCQIPFAQTKANNPEVIRLAILLGRTPSSVARKLGNFGAFDPLLAKQGISGLTHASKLDREIWNEFYGRWESLVQESQRLLAKAKVFSAKVEDQYPIIARTPRPTGPSEKPTTVMARLYQSFFRRAILSSYESSCCICGNDLPQLLVASHIVPWASNEGIRADPENGLCLCVLHDKAFDRGLISLNKSYTIVLSSAINKSKSNAVQVTLRDYQNHKISMPRRFPPKNAFLKWHFENVFIR
jgi:putative restriction endonuclease